MSPGAWLWLLSVSALARAADWGDWMIVDEAEAGSSVLLRRITPKSVFVAPTFGCSEGYRQDSLGRCIKHVKVNQAEQWKFYLERLNSMYAPASTGKKPQKEAGPFHISLPIGSDKAQGEVVVKKRLPQTTQPSTSTTSQATTTTTTTTTMPSTTTTLAMQETTTQEAAPPTMFEMSETTNTEREQTEVTTETRKKLDTTEGSAVMLGDQPETTGTPQETPKNQKQSPSQLPLKPFVIIVTNEPTARTEETTFVPTSYTPPVSEREENTTPEASTTTEVASEGTTETTFKYATDSNTRPTESDERFSEVRDIAETSIRPNVRYTSTSTIRPRCDPESEGYDCDPAETEVISHKRVVTPSGPLPSSMPLLEPSSPVRFPTESFAPPRETQQTFEPSRETQQTFIPPRETQQTFVPPRKTQQTFVRFPESTHPHDDRPALWWPSWQVREHPGIRGWPPPEDSSPPARKHFPSFPPHLPHPQTWSDSNAWRRRFSHFQRD